MADFPSFSELFRVYRDETLSHNSNLTLEVIERDGSDANAIGAGATAVGDEVIGQLTRVAASVFLDSARGKDLDRLIFDRYGLPRKPASPGVTSVEFITQTATTGTFAIPAGTKCGTGTGQQYVTTAAATFPFGSVGPITVAVRSTQVGLKQAAAKNTITSLISSIPGAPTDLSVNNPLATTGADNEEGDGDYRNRARQFFVTARRGTLAAIQERALRVPGVTNVSIFEYVDGDGRPARVVQLVITDRFTEALVNVSPSPATYMAQSQLLADSVFIALNDTRPAGIFIVITVAQVIIQGVSLGLSFDAGVSVDSVALKARAAVVSVVNGLNPGEELTNELMLDALRRVPGLIVTGAEILSPVGSVVPGTLEVLRTSLSQVVATSLQPDRALQGSANPDAV